MNDIGAAIIGCGAIFPLHAKAISELAGVKLLAVIDSDITKAKQAGQEYGCQALTDYREILDNKDIQVVHLCTPHYLHADMAIDLLAAGKHVLTEKPLAENLNSAYRMLEASEHSEGQLGVMFQNRYNDSSARMKEMIDSKVLGDLICMKGIVTWYRNEEYYKGSSWRGRWDTEGGGLLINQAIHTLDLLQWFGGDIASIKGSVTTDVLNGTIEVEDTAHANIHFKNNARALFYGTNTYLVNSPVEMELVFEHGTLLMRRDCLYLWKDEQETLLTEPLTTSIGGKSYWGTGHNRLIKDFYSHVKEGREFWLNGAEAIKALKLVSDIYSSSNSKS